VLLRISPYGGRGGGVGAWSDGALEKGLEPGETREKRGRLEMRDAGPTARSAREKGSTAWKRAAHGRKGPTARRLEGG
jgi:hypothetical protein